MNFPSFILFSCYLLTSIFRPVASVTNSSFSFPITDLVMGSNSSETDGRRKLEFNFLYGGFPITGISFTSHGEDQERNCTLSFPAMNNQTKKKGFLTSYVCVTSGVFVGTKQVGLPTSVSGFDRDLGLDYMFVEVYEEYWHDLTSQRIAFTDQLDGVAFDLLPMNIPTQPPFVGISVCAYGGTSEFVCGVILEFNVTISSWAPGSSHNEEPDSFYNVVKVQMEKDYTAGDLGSPVYLPGLIPFSLPSQLVVSPVGQVVEDAEEFEAANIWYYTPINRILANNENLILLTMAPEQVELF